MQETKRPQPTRDRVATGISRREDSGAMGNVFSRLARGCGWDSNLIPRRALEQVNSVQETNKRAYREGRLFCLAPATGIEPVTNP